MKFSHYFCCLSQFLVMVKNGTVLHHYPSGRQKLAERRYMSSEDDTTYRRVGIMQADQTVTADSMDLE